MVRVRVELSSAFQVHHALTFFNPLAPPKSRIDLSRSDRSSLELFVAVGPPEAPRRTVVVGFSFTAAICAIIGGGGGRGTKLPIAAGWWGLTAIVLEISILVLAGVMVELANRGESEESDSAALADFSDKAFCTLLADVSVDNPLEVLGLTNVCDSRAVGFQFRDI
jgi:hypothetical protein